MKNTFTANLGGTIFHIDEDAYKLLDQYLSNIRILFRKEKDADEIVNDFEIRISELFGEWIALGNGVITIVQVNDVIRKMGKPEEIYTEDGNSVNDIGATDGSNGTAGGNAGFGKTAPDMASGKKLMRDVDNKMIGGVASGFAAYFNVDITLVRIIFCLLLLFYGFMIPAYIIMWIVIPEAVTAAQKLLMRGKGVTLENIGKTVTGGFSDNPDIDATTNEVRSVIMRIADLFVKIIGVILKFFAIVFGVVLTPVALLILLILFVRIIRGVIGISGVPFWFLPFGMHFPHGLFSVFNMPSFFTLTLLLVIGIPIIAIIFTATSNIKDNPKPMPSGIKALLLIIWVIAFTFLFGHFIPSIGWPFFR